ECLPFSGSLPSALSRRPVAGRMRLVLRRARRVSNLRVTQPGRAAPPLPRTLRIGERGTMAQSASAPTNIKKLLLPITLAKAGWAIVEAREDVQGVPYDVAAGKAELHRK